MSAVACARCGAPRRDIDRWCSSCGAAIPAGATSATPATNARRPRSKLVQVIAGLFGLAVALSVLGAVAGSSSTGGDVTVTYTLTGSATGADLTYTDSAGNVHQRTDVSVPLIRKSDGGQGLRITVPHGRFVTFSAQNTGDAGTLDCAILADGVEINAGHAAGGYAITMCSATVP